MSGFGQLPSGILVSPESFMAHVSEQDLADFRELLRLSPVAPPTFESKTPQYGLDRAWLKEAKDNWLSSFNWRAHEERINSFPNFKTTVRSPKGEDIRLHFMAMFSQKQDAVPLIIMHGWPGSLLEFIPLLTLLSKRYTPETLPYHVIVPSLPGFAYSDSPTTDLDVNDVAQLMDSLMVTLGFGENGYIAQGGDVGYGLACALSNDSSSCKAIHVNALTMPPDEKDMGPLTPAESVQLQRGMEMGQTGMAYAVLQATKPATVGLALSSSPLAILAWIGEKMLAWADSRDPIPLDTILAEATLYWFTNSMSRNLWPYRHLIAAEGLKVQPPNRSKPLGYSHFPAENIFVPVEKGKSLFPNMIRYQQEKGGHFAALEQPEALLSDLEDFVKTQKGLFSS